MIYYPRPEHSFISYDNNIVHHAIAIPKGEGRYIMNRMTGEVKTVKGPAMYLPDPRVEVVVKRTLTEPQCKLWYPNNSDVLKANGHLNDELLCTTACLTKSIGAALVDAISEQNNNFNRSNSYTKPRTISLDSSKYEGAVVVNVWTGYAVNVISKDGNREVVCGPKTIVLDYDQTLEMLELSTGKPKTTDNLTKIVYLNYKNNCVTDIVNAETSDFAKVSIKVSYIVNFNEANKDNWFSVDNYVKRLCDWARSKIKKAIKKYSLAEIYNKYNDVVTSAISDENGYHKFSENGMAISDVEVFSLRVNDQNIQDMIDHYQEKIIANDFDLNLARQSTEITRETTALKCEKVELTEAYSRYKMEQEAASMQKDFEFKIAHEKAKDEEKKRRQEFEVENQKLKEAIFQAEQACINQKNESEIAYKKALADIEAEREAKAANSMEVILNALGPDLAAALNNSNNQETIKAIAQAISLYALARGENVAMTVTNLMRGTTLEEVLKTIKNT